MRRTVSTFDLGEGPRWFHERWYFVDILQGRLLSLDGGDGELEPHTLLELEQPLGAVAAVAGEEPGTWIAALGDGMAVVRHRKIEWIDRPEAGARPPLRMNDGVCDPVGRFWAGSMAYDAIDGVGSLFRVDPDGTVERVLDGLTVPNGPAFSADGATMFLADSAKGVIRRYSVDVDTGAVGAGEIFATVDDAAPDGMVLDNEHHLWVAMWGGGRIDRFDQGGRRSESIALPSTQPTAPCFGGPSGRELLVTSASYGLTSPSAVDGAVWHLRSTVSGPPSRSASIQL